MKKFEVIEDNGGGLTLAVFAEDAKVEYIHSGYEYTVGQLTTDLKALENGDDPAKDWDGNCGGLEWEFGDDPQEIYDNLKSFEYGWKVVKDNEGIYPEKMGTAAMIEFGLE